MLILRHAACSNEIRHRTSDELAVDELLMFPDICLAGTGVDGGESRQRGWQ